MSKKEYNTILVASICLAITMMDMAMMAVALPTITKEMNLYNLAPEWVINSFILSMASFGIITGKLSDIYNPKYLVSAGIILFIISSIGCFFSLNYIQLIIFRAFQGIGCIFFVTPVIKLLSIIFKKNYLSKAIGTATGFGSIGMIIAPVLSGQIIKYLSWRYIFLINIPLSIICLITLSKIHIKIPRNYNIKIDKLGFLFLALFLCSLVLLIMEAPKYNYNELWIEINIIITSIFLISFIMVERKKTNPLIAYKLFKKSKFILINILNILIQAQSVTVIFCIMYSQISLGYSPTQTGLLFMPLYVLIAISSFLSGGIIQKKGGYITMIIGAGFIFTGYIATLILLPLKNYFSLLPVIIGSGISFSIFSNSLRVIAIESVPKKYSGLSIGIIANLRQISGAISIAILGSIISSSTLSKTISIQPVEFYFGFQKLIILSSIVCFIILILSIYTYKHGEN